MTCLFSGCKKNKRENNSTPPAAPAAPPAAAPPSDTPPTNDSHNSHKPKEEPVYCHKNDFNPRPINTTKNIHIERQYQRVVRYNCQDQVTSDKVETVKSPHGGNVKIRPKVLDSLTQQPAYKGQWLKIENRQRCEGGTVTFDDLDRMVANLFVDMAPGVFSFQVQAGTNIIDYIFYICKELDAKQECISKLVEEEGSLVLDVDYVEKNLQGIRQIHPTEEECKPQPSSTPTPIS
jgi:hypothetical protein